jgi:hypothetical protein
MHESQAMEIMEEIYPKLDLTKVVANLHPVDHGTKYLVMCPKCHKKEAFLSKENPAIRCNRMTHCGYHSTLWEYYRHEHSLDAEHMLREFANMANYPLPESF